MTAPSAHLVARRHEGRGAVLDFQVPSSHTDAYTRPGQYCVVHAGGAAGYFAIARVPGAGPLAFYVQPGGATATALLALPISASVEVDPPQGPGFDLGRCRAATRVLAAATGSGYAGLRAAVLVLAAEGRPVDLYLGLRRAADRIFAEDEAAVLAAGGRVHLVLSRPEDGDPDPYRVGYVQAALAADAPSLAGAAVLGCGQKDMLHELRRVGASLGLPEGGVLTNF